jgi:anti-sigma factor RsiW
MSEHGKELLGAYVLGVLDADEHSAVQSHLDDCAACRREVGDLRDLEAALGEIPPEAFLDGPPPDGDFLLQRTLQEVRAESTRRVRFTRAAWALAAAAVVAVALAGGIVVGRAGSPPPVATAGSRTGVATDPTTGATMSVAVRPAAGWVRVHATISGVPPGEQCRLYVVAADGSREPAGSWLSGSGETSVDGSALMAPAEVTGVQAETYAGEILVAVPI